MYGSQSTQAWLSYVCLLFSCFSNIYHFVCVWPTALRLGCVTNLDTLFLVMGFISLVDKIQFMLISCRHICIKVPFSPTSRYPMGWGWGWGWGWGSGWGWGGNLWTRQASHKSFFFGCRGKLVLLPSGCTRSSTATDLNFRLLQVPGPSQNRILTLNEPS